MCTAPLLLWSHHHHHHHHGQDRHLVDTIFHAEAIKHALHGTFIINRLNPQSGEVLETTGKSDKLRGAMASQVVLVPRKEEGP